MTTKNALQHQKNDSSKNAKLSRGSICLVVKQQKPCQTNEIISKGDEKMAKSSISSDLRNTKRSNTDYATAALTVGSENLTSMSACLGSPSTADRNEEDMKYQQTEENASNNEPYLSHHIETLKSSFRICLSQTLHIIHSANVRTPTGRLHWFI